VCTHGAIINSDERSSQAANSIFMVMIFWLLPLRD